MEGHDSGPSTSSENFKVFKGTCCIICDDKKGPLSDKETNLTLAPKGLAMLKQSCEERQNDVAEKLLPCRLSPELARIRFHFFFFFADHLTPV